ncbi:MAG: hypothetical protein ACYCZW_03185 [Minisyncoccota bacterium]
MKKFIPNTTTIYLFLITVFPSVSFAAFDKLKGLLKDFKSLLDLTIPVIFALALLFFFFGMAQFIRSVNEKTIEEGKNKMIWGIVALFVMVSIWGIVKYVGDALGIETNIKSTKSIDTKFDPCDSDPGGPNCPDQ